MAARKNKINHDEKTKKLIQASQLVNRLISFANDECEMSSAQVNAAKIVIGKYIPDLSSVQVKSDVDMKVSGGVVLIPAKHGKD